MRSSQNLGSNVQFLSRDELESNGLLTIDENKENAIIKFRFCCNLLFDHKMDILIAGMCYAGSYMMSKSDSIMYMPLSDFDWSNHAYPHKNSSITITMVFIFCASSAFIAAFAALVLFREKSYKINLACVITFLISAISVFAITQFITQVIKLACGRLRPDFIARCYPKEYKKGVFPPIDFNYIRSHLNCDSSARDSMIRDGRKSFPSGHSSYSASSGLISAMFLHDCWKIYLHRKIRKTIDDSNNVNQLNAPVIPKNSEFCRLSIATSSVVLILFLAVSFVLPVIVALSRVTDYRHSPIDVFFGLALGYITALIGYRHMRPCIMRYHDSRLM